MEDFKVRLVKEYVELKEKKEKLYTFIVSPSFNSLDKENRTLLEDQYHVMTSYVIILEKRIDLILANQEKEELRYE